MRFLEVIVILLLFAALFLGSYFLWLNLPRESLEFEEFRAGVSGNLSGQSVQFYPNLRFQDKIIKYSVESACSQKKRNDAISAFQIIEGETILEFVEVSHGEIEILCSNIAPEPEQKNHFVAGEGGPTKIINASIFSVILEAKVSLFRTDKCETPQIALHEVLHALGFDHNNNGSSIMFPVTDCDQKIDDYLIEEINRVYSTPSLPDVIIESIQANKTNRNLNFVAVIANNGLSRTEEAKLIVKVGEVVVKEFEMEEFEVGSKRQLTVSNLKIPRNAEEITFFVETSSPEISKDNNEVKIKIVQSS